MKAAESKVNPPQGIDKLLAEYGQLRIEKILPGVSTPGGMVTIRYAFDRGKDAVQSSLPPPTDLAFDGLPAKFTYEGPGIVKAKVPLGTRLNVPIPVILKVGGVTSQPYADFIVKLVSGGPGRLRPVILRVVEISPQRAHPGEIVRIVADPPATPAGMVYVTFDGRSAEVSFEGTNLMARVPADLLTDRRAAVILTVGKQRSEPFTDFFVLAHPLLILSVAPNPAKPGDILHIYIRPPYQFIPGTKWFVLLDSMQVQASEVNPERFEIVMQVPEALRALAPVVVLKTDRQQSSPFVGLRVEHPIPAGYVILGAIAVVIFVGSIYYLVRRTGRRGPQPSVSPADPMTDQNEISYPLPDLPAELVTACMNNECVLYVGAGLSASAGFPTWRSFVQGLLDWAAERQILDPSRTDALRRALQQGDAGAVAESVVTAVGPQKDILSNHLRQVFADPKPDLPKTHRFIGSIGFSGIVTANFDTLIERTFEESHTRIFTPSDAELLLEALSKRNFFILKLYGMLERPETVLVAPEQYLDATARNISFTQFMETLFFSRTLLFLGASLEGIEDYLKGITFREYVGKPHYALVNLSGTAWQAKAASLSRRYGIHVLPYTATGGFPEVSAFLSRLEKQAGGRSAGNEEGSTAGKSTAFRSSPITRVRLENIGPFERLEISLDPHMNILLGDNGVGKSTILKAIAVAICGKDAQRYAGRLIRTGQPEGKIILETERNQYLTQLLRKDREAELVARPGRPLEAEGWLAIGFPPLRSVSWEPAKEPQPQGKSTPRPDDLLPIVRGDPDPRMDKLKQWLVNLDYLIATEEKKPDSIRRYRGLREEFFRIVDVMTPGVEVRFKGVDPVTKVVTVTTDDGDVPIESISQGTTSLISWIGVLLQRLYEVYGEEHDPIKRYSLVLIDEIDAHMHPSWQRMLVKHLDSIFPDTQFVATTHSPLIVGGMSPQQVFRLVRQDNGKVGQLTIDPEWLMGRADQLLTTDLFGMNTTVDTTTEQSLPDYLSLLANSKRTEDEEQQFQRLRRILRFRIPMSGETLVERSAQELLQSLVMDQFSGDLPEVQAAIMQKAEKLFSKIESRKRMKTS